MPKAIVVHELGGPEVLRFEDVADVAPGPGQARVRHTAIGVNFIDVYFRTGLYKAPALPFIPGQEGAGVVEAVGPDVTDVAVGDRVAYAGLQGAYAEVRLVPAARLVKLPPAIDDRTAAAMMLKGMTAEYPAAAHARASNAATRSCSTPLPAASARSPASGRSRWARASSGPRAAPTRSRGRERWAATRSSTTSARTSSRGSRSITGGAGVRAVFDGVGKSTFDASLACLATRGMLALFGQSSGIGGAVRSQLCWRKASLFLTRPVLGHYVATREELVQSAAKLFDGRRQRRGEDRGRRRPTRCADAARAHRTWKVARRSDRRCCYLGIEPPPRFR